MFWHPRYWKLPEKVKFKLNNLKIEYKSMNSEMQFSEHFVVASFFISGIVCLSFSTVYHTFLCYSYQAQKILGMY